ncbi:hypothetical protein ACFO4P_17700 [Epilithonimonas pallida]|uniref:Uncharacterized protein n=1 Tax=Epilithonimonas pallida TaxID=373671 RepID=A0ABY1R4R1_9FLAO|nr:hypothetical protein [Epilithonimonas pallida]SMP95122.1 hypothetical protein SAMN05421679_106227 [Epilithonimonas pallida]
MDKKDLKRIYDEYFSQLRKIINSWNLISGSPDDEFDSLNNKILSQLYKNADAEKIDRILQSELISTYGLFSNEFDSEIFVNQIMKWWNLK